MGDATGASNTQSLPAFEVSDLRYAYDAATALAVDHCRLERGSSLAILGQSGSGKSTLLNLLAGLLSPTSGSVAVLGQDLSELRGAQIDRFRGQHLGLVFQRLHLLPALNVRENLLLAVRLARTTLDTQRYDRLVEQLGLADLTQRRPAQLSVGQAQRAAIARALIHGPSLVLADEPTSALDDEHALQALAMLREATASVGSALLVVTHDQRIRHALDHEFQLVSPS